MSKIIMFKMDKWNFCLKSIGIELITQMLRLFTSYLTAKGKSPESLKSIGQF